MWHCLTSIFLGVLEIKGNTKKSSVINITFSERASLHAEVIDISSKKDVFLLKKCYDSFQYVYKIKGMFANTKILDDNNYTPIENEQNMFLKKYIQKILKFLLSHDIYIAANIRYRIYPNLKNLIVQELLRFDIALGISFLSLSLLRSCAFTGTFFTSMYSYSLALSNIILLFLLLAEMDAIYDFFEKIYHSLFTDDYKVKYFDLIMLNFVVRRLISVVPRLVSLIYSADLRYDKNFVTLNAAILVILLLFVSICYNYFPSDSSGSRYIYRDKNVAITIMKTKTEDVLNRDDFNKLLNCLKDIEFDNILRYLDKIINLDTNSYLSENGWVGIKEMVVRRESDLKGGRRKGSIPGSPLGVLIDCQAYGYCLFSCLKSMDYRAYSIFLILMDEEEVTTLDLVSMLECLGGRIKLPSFSAANGIIYSGDIDKIIFLEEGDSDDCFHATEIKPKSLAKYEKGQVKFIKGKKYIDKESKFSSIKGILRENYGFLGGKISNKDLKNIPRSFRKKFFFLDDIYCDLTGVPHRKRYSYKNEETSKWENSIINILDEELPRFPEKSDIELEITRFDHGIDCIHKKKIFTKNLEIIISKKREVFSNRQAAYFKKLINEKNIDFKNKLSDLSMKWVVENINSVESHLKKTTMENQSFQLFSNRLFEDRSSWEILETIHKNRKNMGLLNILKKLKEERNKMNYDTKPLGENFRVDCNSLSFFGKAAFEIRSRDHIELKAGRLKKKIRKRTSRLLNKVSSFSYLYCRIINDKFVTKDEMRVRGLANRLTFLNSLKTASQDCKDDSKKIQPIIQAMSNKIRTLVLTKNKIRTVV